MKIRIDSKCHARGYGNPIPFPSSFPRIFMFFSALVLSVFLLCPGNAVAKGFSGGMGGMTGIEDFFRHLPPIIRKVTQKPVRPAADENVLITANVAHLKFVEDFEAVDSVYIYYSIDGGDSWEEIEMSQEDNEISWTEYIPGQPAGTGVLYYIEAVDTVGNIAREMPGNVAMSDDWYYMSDEDFADAYPNDYLVRMYDDTDDDTEYDIPSYLNLLEMDFGYEDDFYHFRMEFESPVEIGTVSPLDAKGYFFVLFNRSLILSRGILKELRNAKPDKAPDMAKLDKHRSEIVDLIERLWVWYHAPLVEILPPLPGIEKLNGVDMLHLDLEASGCPVADMKSLSDLGKMDERFLSCLKFESEGWSYKLTGNYLDLTIDRSLLGPAGDDTIIFLTGNIRIAGSDMTKPEFLPGDISLSAAVTMHGHSYVVDNAASTPVDKDDSLSDDDVLEWE